MAITSQNSTIVYTPQPYYTATTASVTDYVAIDTVENRPGVLDPDLSNFTTVIPNSGVSEFGIRINFSNITAPYEAIDMSCALVGCSMLTYEDSGGNPDLDTVFNEDIVCAMAELIGTNGNQLITYAHSSQNEIRTFGREPLPGIIAGGQTNLVFHGLGPADARVTSVNVITFAR